MSDLYRFYPVVPINVAGKGEVAPTGYVSPGQRAIRNRQTGPYSALQDPRASGPHERRTKPPEAPAVSDDWRKDLR